MDKKHKVAKLNFEGETYLIGFSGSNDLKNIESLFRHVAETIWVRHFANTIEETRQKRQEYKLEFGKKG